VKPKMLIIDDEQNFVEQMRRVLESEYEIMTASEEEKARQLFANTIPAVVTLDIALNQENTEDLPGLRILEHILNQAPSTRVIIITGNKEENSALYAMRLGAFDYYLKPVNPEEIRVIIRRAFHIHQLQQRLQQSSVNSADGFQDLIAESKAMKDIFRFIERIAVSDIPVLISGESGTGKELVAKAIHNLSQRKNNPFVTVNCGGIPENLLECALFGYEKGAFTGAYAQKPGKFKFADTGTLFLDEIGELGPALQVKLLRFLQNRQIETVGGTQPIDVDVRIITATNRDLRKSMQRHVFREDLYYRLKIVSLDLPPLRERKEDIVPLAQYFIRKFCCQERKPPLTLSSEAEAALLTYSWPGNIRELENLITRAVVLSSSSVLKANDLGFTLNNIPANINLKFAKKAIEADFIKKALTKNNGIVSRAAKDLGISRVNLYELMDRYNIQIQEFKTDRLTDKSQHVKGREVF
jgi:two-component system, NtrC family, response regulator